MKGCKNLWGNAKQINGDWKKAYSKPKNGIFSKSNMMEVYSKPKKMAGI